jgi:hypothetical protein
LFLLRSKIIYTFSFHCGKHIFRYGPAVDLRGNGPKKALQGGYIPEFDPVHRWFKNIHFFRASRRDIILMADAVPAPPEKQLLNTPSEGFAVSACVRIQSGYLSYAKSVFVLQGRRAKNRIRRLRSCPVAGALLNLLDSNGYYPYILK